MDITLWLPEIIIAFIALVSAVAVAVINRKGNKESAESDQAASQQTSLDARQIAFEQNLMEKIGIQEATITRYTDRVEALELRMEKLRSENVNLKNQVQQLTYMLEAVEILGEHSELAMWAKDRDGRRITHNGAYEKLTGVPLIEAVNKTDFEIMGPGAEDICESWDRQDQYVLRTGNAIKAIELCAHRADSTKRFLVVSMKWPTKLGRTIIGTEGMCWRVCDFEKLKKEYYELYKDLWPEVN